MSDCEMPPRTSCSAHPTASESSSVMETLRSSSPEGRKGVTAPALGTTCSGDAHRLQQIAIARMIHRQGTGQDLMIAALRRQSSITAISAPKPDGPRLRFAAVPTSTAVLSAGARRRRTIPTASSASAQRCVNIYSEANPSGTILELQSASSPSPFGTGASSETEAARRF